MTQRRCVCPGSFDPVTNGHLDIIERASRALRRGHRRRARSTRPRPGCSTSTSGSRCCAEVTADLRQRAGRLLPRACSSTSAATGDIPVIVKGLRAVSDFDYELQMAQMNHRLSRRRDVVRADQPGRTPSCRRASSRRSRRTAATSSGLVPDAVLAPADRPLARPPDEHLTSDRTRARTAARGRARQARRAHRPRRERPVDADVGLLHRQPRPRCSACSTSCGRCCPRSSGHAELLLRRPRGGRRRGPPARPTGSSPRPRRSGCALVVRDRGRTPRPSGEAGRIRDEARRGGAVACAGEVDDYVDSQAGQLRGRPRQDPGRGAAGAASKLRGRTAHEDLAGVGRTGRCDAAPVRHRDRRLTRFGPAPTRRALGVG